MSFEKTMAVAEKLKARNEAKGVSQLNANQKLEIYGWMQQGKIGNVNTERPGVFSPVERAKWDAWEKCKGMSKEEAQKKYIEKITECVMASK